MNKRQIAIEMRIKDGKSYSEIMNELGVAKSTLSGWLKSLPLPEDLKIAKQKSNHKGGAVKKQRGEKSKYQEISERFATLNNADKGRIAEAAIVFRLTLIGISVYRSVFDCDHFDMLAYNPTSKKILKLQIKWAKETKQGLPYMSLHSSSKKIRYQDGAFDIFVGYDLFTDTAYVYTQEELKKNRAFVSIRDDCAESWNKLV